VADRTIDSHQHAWTTETELPWKNDGPSAVERVVYTADDALTDMDTLAIDQACLVATPIHGTGSPYVRDCLTRHPDRFYGILTLDYTADDVRSSVDDALTIPNALGFRITTDDSQWLASEALDGFWSALESHTDPQVQLLTTPETFGAVETVVAENPHVTFVLDHMGSPDPGTHTVPGSAYDGLGTISNYSNVYVKVTHTPTEEVYPFEDLRPYVRYLLSQFGSDRLLWGSDFIYHFKQATPWETLYFLDEFDCLSRSDRRDLRYRTFKSLVP
jgi:L-fuconolactonase